MAIERYLAVNFLNGKNTVSRPCELFLFDEDTSVYPKVSGLAA